MRSLALGKLVSAAALAVAALCAMTGAAEAGYIQTNLVSDLPNLAEIQDTALVNPWGISYNPVSLSPVWVSDQGTNFTTLYAVTGSLGVSKVAPAPTNGDILIPTTASGPQGPTGQVANTTTSFQIPILSPVGTTPAHFIFANLNGTISAWAQGPTPAAIEATTPGAIYTGLAIGSVSGTPYLYAANGASTGNIQVFDGMFNNVTNTTFAGAFVDPNPPAGYVPFNVQNINGEIYVTYAPATIGADRTPQTMATLGQGYVDVFDTSGNFIGRVISDSMLAAPWGIALAPADWGPFSNDLLVANFSYINSEINAFNPTTGAFIGSIPFDIGAGNTPGGLWALEFGMGGSNANPETLFFTDGINGETDGLFAAITFSVPEPSTLALFVVGLGFFVVGRFGFRLRPRT